MNILKKNYKSVYVDLKQTHSKNKMYFILSNYSKKINALYHPFRNKKSIIIPNSTRYMHYFIDHNKFNIVITNNLKGYSQNVNKPIVFEYKYEHNSSRKRNYFNNMLNIIFQHSMFFDRIEKKFKNIFIFENIHNFKFFSEDDIGICNNKNIIIFKNMKKIKVLIEQCNLRILRNTYNLYICLFDVGNNTMFDISVLHNTFKLYISHDNNLLNVSKLTTNHTLIVDNLEKNNIRNLKYNFMYITKLIIYNDDIKNIFKYIIFTGKTVRILGTDRCNGKKCNDKYIDYLFCIR